MRILVACEESGTLRDACKISQIKTPYSQNRAFVNSVTPLEFESRTH